MDDFKTPEEFIAHYGVPGMKWGSRKNTIEGVSARTNRDAAKDAKEFARAKAYYGQGAGTRRKLIKNTVEGKSKRDPSYKKAFDQHLGNQDMAKRTSEAKSKRKRTDAVNATTKTARGIGHMARGNARYASMAAAGIFTVAAAAHRTGADRKVYEYGKKTVTTLLKSPFVQNFKP